ncbi:MAG: PrgI family protein [Patescibacteria group bacterium]|jgi:signal transduction histidine kinase
MGAKIPQDVTREDKLVGPLTLKQFLYILGAAGIDFIVYQSYALGYLYFPEFLLLAVIVTLFSLALAFMNVNGRPFGVFLLNLLHFSTTGHNLAWYKEPRDVVAAIKIKASDLKDTKTEIQERQSGKQIKMQIEQLASVLDTGGTIEQNNTSVTAPISNLNASSAPTIETEDVEDVLADVD